ncbi:peptide-methionine (S)-S-oxide reductase [Croceivirga radicis]|uniref:Peptide methionine sulfoxide reductase MsrA n=1 Tax=Croceivirga radicis TaxID=1929488 RepID=A0A1V6LQI1_9FLAO|nr:peptide-methionine (S)-S-oxide reductase MsrA [Croceivirga radicis]OQD42369.1 peptide-methionine (S)-S-oxide reductase [Croceivirga radicis]
MKNYILLVAFIAMVSCKGNTKSQQLDTGKVIQNTKETKNETTQDLSAYETAYFASGCFWCVEAIFESVKGVKEVVSGYSGGSEKNPSYEDVSYGRTRHAEAVEVYYDPEVISYFALVQVFFGSHDPTTVNRQGPDKGAQYRSIAFYKNEKEKKTIQDYITLLVSEDVYGDDEIVTQVEPFEKFWPAEDYHQDFEKRNPNHSYIKAVSVPRLNRFKANFKDYLKEDLEH